MADNNSSFEALQSSLKTALISTTRTTSALCAEDLPFQRSLEPSFASNLDRQNARLLSLAQRLLASAAAVPVGEDVVSSRSTSSGKHAAAPRLEDGDALERDWSSVVDVVDSLLERTDGVLDELRGVIRKGLGSAGAKSETPAAAVKQKRSFQQAANILKPQRGFAVPPDNFATGPWKPILTTKPHAKVPLEKSLRTDTTLDGKDQYDTTFYYNLEQKFNASFYVNNHKSLADAQLRSLVDSKIRFRHPYQTEIEEYKYPPTMYQRREPIKYLPYESTQATLVDTEEAMEEMLAELKQAKEIAIDLEHHDQRTYIGVVCLMQISTREKDWIVDTLKPWRRRLECLNEVFADPSILKVLHGSAMDVIWLQRDLGLYLVGLFDTEHAATALHYKKRSLAFLLEKFVNFQAQKQYQLADWRVRPLSPEMFDYARSDTHFLLYVYDCMRNELLDYTNLNEPDGDLIQRVLNGSKTYQLQRYENPIYDSENGMGPGGWYRALLKMPALLSKQQFAVFKAVHQWRDTMARREDEGIFFVMSNHLLTTIARDMPTTKEALFAMSPANARIPRQHASELLEVVGDAKERGLHGPEMNEAMDKSGQLAGEEYNNRFLAKQQMAATLNAHNPPAAPAQTTVTEAASSPKRPVPDAASDNARSGNSSFWGSTLGSPLQRRPLMTDVKLSLPMPEVSGDVYAANGAFSMQDTVNDSPAPTTPAEKSAVPTPRSKTEEIFTIRGMPKTSKKRKAEDTSDVLKAGMDEVGLDSEIEEAKQEEVERQVAKRARREAKRASRQQEAQEAGVNGQAKSTSGSGFLDSLVPASESTTGANTSNGTLNSKKHKKDKKLKDGKAQSQTTVPKSQADKSSGFLDTLNSTSTDQPFDYASAPSLLGAAPGIGEKSKKSKGGKKGKMDGFDPYKKALDAPKGLPQNQKERTGKSGTFMK